MSRRAVMRPATLTRGRVAVRPAASQRFERGDGGSAEVCVRSSRGGVGVDAAVAEALELGEALVVELFFAGGHCHGGDSNKERGTGNREQGTRNRREARGERWWDVGVSNLSPAAARPSPQRREGLWTMRGWRRMGRPLTPSVDSGRALTLSPGERGLRWVEGRGTGGEKDSAG